MKMVESFSESVEAPKMVPAKSTAKSLLVAALFSLGGVGAGFADIDGLNVRLKEALEGDVAFHEKARACYRRFAELRQQASNAAGQPLSPAQGAAASVSDNDAYMEWLRECMREQGHEIGTAGETDIFGRVDLPEEPKDMLGKLQRALTLLHERSHQTSQLEDAETAGLDFEKWRCWGDLYERLSELRKAARAPEDVFLVAMADPAIFGGTLPAALQEARDQLTATDIECIQWYLDHSQEIDRYLALRGDFTRIALEEVREYTENIELGGLLVQALDRLLAACEDRALETNSFRSCYPLRMDRQAIVDQELIELSGMFESACDPYCLPRFEVVPIITETDCRTSFGGFGRWVDVRYTARCVAPE